MDRLQSYSSPSVSITPTPGDVSPPDLESAPGTPKLPHTDASNLEQTPLIGHTDPHYTTSHAHDRDSYGAVHYRGHCHNSLVNGDASAFFEGHHRHESRDAHQSHHERTRHQTMYGPVGFERVPPSSVAHINHDEPGHRCHLLEGAEGVADSHSFHHHHHGHQDKVKVGKNRQIVGILVRLDFFIY